PRRSSDLSRTLASLVPLRVSPGSDTGGRAGEGRAWARRVGRRLLDPGAPFISGRAAALSAAGVRAGPGGPDAGGEGGNDAGALHGWAQHAVARRVERPARSWGPGEGTVLGTGRPDPPDPRIDQRHL